MEAQPLITVIVPVYNVEKYLRRCLDSIIGQTYQNLEILCIDDGSTDSSGEICDQYAAQDKRIKVFHQENQGLSAARNKGLDAATGEYIAFVDSDDYIVADMYEKMMHAILLHNVEICVCQWQYEFADGRQVVKAENIDPAIYGRKSSAEFARFLYHGSYENGVVVAVWNKLYHREVLHTTCFEGLIHEDDAFNDKINSQNVPICVIKDQLYIYAQNSGSLTNKPFAASKFFFWDILIRREELFRDDDFIRQETELLYCNMYIEYYLKAVEAGIAIPTPDKYRLTFRQMFQSLCCNGGVNSKFKLRMKLFLLSPALYRLATKR